MSTGKKLVIVESPAKAKTIKKFLGANYKVIASMGHVRDLPKSQLGIDAETGFTPKYITIRGKGDILKELRKEAKNASFVYLATDPDREGEAISWHLAHILNIDPNESVRISFNEITKNAVKNSIKNSRQINMDLVHAQQARRILDRIVGYTISPLLWKKVKKGLSAGRVQSVALKMICDREEEIRNFIPEEYWSLDVLLETGNKETIKAALYGSEEEKLEIKTRTQMDEVLTNLKGKTFICKEVIKSKRHRKAYAPFITSTLQQEASRNLGFTSQKTMQIAQQLYEGVDIKGEGTVGLVTYIRTDSYRVSDEAYNEVKDFIVKQYGENYLNSERPQYKNKGKTQDAHEAIRPSGVLRLPEDIKQSLTKDQYRLYSLIWERFVGSQMAQAEYDTLTVKINAGDYIFKAHGSVLVFPGFLKVYKNLEEGYKDEQMPPVKEGVKLKKKEIIDAQHFTKPQPRYNEASLVKSLEEGGVGRPSTYAPTISTIVNRRYVVKEERQFYPTELGEIVNEIMEDYFENIVDIDFTAKMEQDLDKVEDGEISWDTVIKEFYPKFMELYNVAEEKISKVEIRDEVTDIVCEKCGRNMVIKYGNYGKFLACPGFPECQNAKPFYEDAGATCPKCKGKVLIMKTKKGRKFYGCENHPECDFMSWNLPADKPCPLCNEYLVIKGGKKPILGCSSPDCVYTEKIEDKKD